jgi:hypothetical protein
MNPLVAAVIAFALFIVCPRMAGMTTIIAKASETNLILVAFIGTLISLPLIVAMVIIFKSWGLWAALAFAVFTDLLAALVMGAINWKASFETFIVALFVLAGVRVATLLSAWLP